MLFSRTVKICLLAFILTLFDVDLNTASAPIRGGVKAKNIVAWRDEHGKFSRRDQLKKIPRLGARA